MPTPWTAHDDEQQIMDGLRLRSRFVPSNAVGQHQTTVHHVTYIKTHWPLTSDGNPVAAHHTLPPGGELKFSVGKADSYSLDHHPVPNAPFWTRGIRPGFRLTPDDFPFHEFHEVVLRKPVSGGAHLHEGPKSLTMKVTFDGETTHVVHNLHLL